MGILKPVLMLAILSSVMVCNNAWATTPPPRVGATRAESPPPPPVAKAQTPTPKSVKKRRAVRQIPADMAPPPAPQVLGPRLAPLPAIGVAPAPSPLLLNGCPNGACTDGTGARYHGGVGTTLLSPEGRVCSNNGITVQCF
jgi:hypothetical protein